ncbi:hypothetical protein M3571_19430, partial [Bacillus pumilus]
AFDVALCQYTLYRQAAERLACSTHCANPVEDGSLDLGVIWLPEVAHSGRKISWYETHPVDSLYHHDHI